MSLFVKALLDFNDVMEPEKSIPLDLEIESAEDDFFEAMVSIRHEPVDGSESHPHPGRKTRRHERIMETRHAGRSREDTGRGSQKMGAAVDKRKPPILSEAEIADFEDCFRSENPIEQLRKIAIAYLK
jgi:hypothetical protein